MGKLRAGIVGATGMVGQRFIERLHQHPDFTVTTLAASANSAGKTYAEAVGNRWCLAQPIPSAIAGMKVLDALQVKAVAEQVDCIFCAVDLPKAEVMALEEAYAKAEVVVVSNNSAARGVADIPMIVPELNADHLAVLPAQRKRLGTRKGCIVVKSNCSLQSYVPALHPLRDFGLQQVTVCTYQAISGAGKTFQTWPEMVDNVIPHIGGEEHKSEQEPLKIWGTVQGGTIVNASGPLVSAQCIRVPATDGHLAAVSVRFAKKPSREEILERWKNFSGRAQQLKLPSAPTPFLTYFSEDNRPQTKLDRDLGGGMGIALGRLREDSIFDYKFIGLSHNTIRGAAGGAVLMGELLKAEGLV